MNNFNFVKRGNMKEGKFVPSGVVEAKLGVKENTSLGPKQSLCWRSAGAGWHICAEGDECWCYYN